MAVDEERERLDRAGDEALRRREEADARVEAALEEARAREHFLRLFRGAAEKGETGAGFVARVEAALNSYKAKRMGEAVNPRAHSLMQGAFDTLAAEVKEQALKTEARTRTRERIAAIGNVIDQFVAASKAAPVNFRAYHESARSSLDRLDLPQEAVDAFRRRLPEIPLAALAALTKQDPAAALESIKRRSGPADPAFGIERHAMRLLRKRADAALRERKHLDDEREAVRANRAVIDGHAAIGAVKRGEAELSALAGLFSDDSIGGRHARTLKRERDEVWAESRSARKAAATVRSLMARGEKPDAHDAAHVAGIDLVYEREVAASRRSFSIGDAEGDRDDVAFAVAAGVLPKLLARRIREALAAEAPASAAWAARLVEMLERADQKLTARLDADVLAEAHEIIDVAAAGVDWEEAVRLLREGVDLAPEERARREKELAHAIDGRAVTRMIGDALKVATNGTDDTTSAHRRMPSAS